MSKQKDKKEDLSNWDDTPRDITKPPKTNFTKRERDEITKNVDATLKQWMEDMKNKSKKNS